jgi:rubrerythrin
MRIDTDNYLTIAEAAKELGAPNKRPIYRAINRAKAAGHETTVTLYGKLLVPRKSLAVLKNYYFPYYSEAHQKMVKEWGRRGGTQKRINAEARS